MNRLLVLGLCCAFAVAGCSSKPKVFAPDDKVQAVRFAAPPPAEIILFTSLNATTGGGAHSGLIISGRERVLFDPAGTFEYQGMPERHDVLYGVSDRNLDVYRDFHVRPENDLVEQRLFVPQSVADDLIARAERTGPVNDAFCASSISALLAETPGLSGLKKSLFPKQLSKNFGELPNVKTIFWTEETYVPLHGVPFEKEPEKALPVTN